MATRVVYLDVDDELTSAASRIRSLDADQVALVLPFGSRVATSRINFRLLSRDALGHEKRLSIIAADPATRALAASAGLAVFASVAEFEAALSSGESGIRATGSVGRVAGAGAAGAAAGLAAGSAGSRSGSVGPTGATSEPTPPAGRPPGIASPDGDPTRTGATVRAQVGAAAAPDDLAAPVGAGAGGRPPRPPVATGGAGAGRPRNTLLAGVAILALAGLIAVVGVYLLLPSATIAVTPKPERIGPIQFTVVADPTVTTPDTANLVVPATQVSVDVTASGTYPATGKRVAETPATGVVRFENLDFLRTNTIQAGSVVGTNSGVRFRTNGTVTVPKADIIGLSLFPGRIAVDVTAVKPGVDGNVDPNTIVVVPGGEDPVALKVSNPTATSGGTHQEFPRVTQADVDGAIAALTAKLDADFRTKLSDPSVAPAGSTVFPDTGELGPVTATPDPATVVGQEVASFDLTATATGTAIAADTSAVTALAEDQIKAQVSPGHQLVPGSVQIDVGDGVAVGQTVRFRVTASAEQIAVLDPDHLKDLVLGKPVEEAKAILAPFGTVTIDLSPDWVGTVPNFANRVTVTIDQPVEVVTPTPSPTRRPTASPAPSAAPTLAPSSSTRPSPSRPAASPAPSGSAG